MIYEPKFRLGQTVKVVLHGFMDGFPLDTTCDGWIISIEIKKISPHSVYHYQYGISSSNPAEVGSVEICIKRTEDELFELNPICP